MVSSTLCPPSRPLNPFVHNVKGLAKDGEGKGRNRRSEKSPRGQDGGRGGRLNAERSFFRALGSAKGESVEVTEFAFKSHRRDRMPLVDLMRRVEGGW